MEIILILLAVTVASGIGTLTGFGLSTILVPVLALFYPLPETLLFVGIIHWFNDIWKLVLFRQGLRWKLILSFGVPGIAATILGASLVFDFSSSLLSHILGAFLLVYVVLLFLKKAIQVNPSAGAGVVGGALSGFLAGIFGMGGTVRSMFLLAFNLPKAVYLSTTGAIALVIDSGRLATYVAKGLKVDPPLAWSMLLFVPASFISAQLAKSVVSRTPQGRFRKVVGVFLLLVALKLLIWPK